MEIFGLDNNLCIFEKQLDEVLFWPWAAVLGIVITSIASRWHQVNSSTGRALKGLFSRMKFHVEMLRSEVSARTLKLVTNLSFVK